ncbi:MAG: serine/threonine protein kinase [Acidimicrobiales bacterium]|nr:serine/threonine protein kinase [Acidimicrobiales bacterium]
MPDVSPPPTGPALAPDRLLARRYRLVRRLARGGMAEVWEAVDEILSRPVAVKILLPHLAADDAFVTRFRREAVAAARLSHPHIVAVFDTWTDDGYEGIVMELVRGTTLRAVLDEQGALPPRRVAAVGAQVADALEVAHRGGLIHRDVKPGNILLTEDGRVLVTDFGIAKASEAASDLTEVGQVVGTAKYLSPEQVEGRPLDPRSDVYALGVVLYEAATGQPPFAADNVTATALARLHAQPAAPRALRADLPPALEAIVMRAMARRPEDRFATAAALRDALEHVDLRPPGLQDTTTTTRPDPTAAFPGSATAAYPAAVATSYPSATTYAPAPARPAPARTGDRRSWPALALLVLVVAATLGLVGALLGRTEPARDLFSGTPLGGGDPLDVTAVTDFDPLGRGGEHPELTANVDDGDPATPWTSEQYRSELSTIKAGVGLVLTLASPSSVSEVEVVTETAGWAAEVYVAESPAPDLAGWGPARASGSALSGSHTFDVDGADGTAVLLWLTDVGDSGRAVLGEVEVRGDAR